MKKVEKSVDKLETSVKKVKKLKVLDIGFMKNIKGGCGSSDADRMCASWCPTYSCTHDGQCGSSYFDF